MHNDVPIGSLNNLWPVQHHQLVPLDFTFDVSSHKNLNFFDFYIYHVKNVELILFLEDKLSKKFLIVLFRVLYCFLSNQSIFELNLKYCLIMIFSLHFIDFPFLNINDFQAFWILNIIRCILTSFNHNSLSSR